jgi:hypothetical protein
VHEVENLFLDPATMQILLEQNGLPGNATAFLLAGADERAGSWIFQKVLSSKQAKPLPSIEVPAKDRAKKLAWSDFIGDMDGTIQSIVSLSRFDTEDAKRFGQLLRIGAQSYERKRESADLWKACEGKQVLNGIAHKLGYSGTPALMNATYALWLKSKDTIPAELTSLRSYLAQL